MSLILKADGIKREDEVIDQKVENVIFDETQSLDRDIKRMDQIINDIQRRINNMEEKVIPILEKSFKVKLNNNIEKETTKQESKIKKLKEKVQFKYKENKEVSPLEFHELRKR